MLILSAARSPAAEEAGEEDVMKVYTGGLMPQKIYGRIKIIKYPAVGALCKIRIYSKAFGFHFINCLPDQIREEER